jgi:hypothetical protein
MSAGLLRGEEGEGWEERAGTETRAAGFIPALVTTHVPEQCGEA